MAGDSAEETLRAGLCLNRCFLFSCFGIETHLFEPYFFTSCFSQPPTCFCGTSLRFPSALGHRL